MALDAPLVAAATLRTTYGTDPQQCSAADVTHQLQLAHVLLDGGYDGVTTLEEALAGGDTGLGTVDRLDGELVVVDGEPWRVDWHGDAQLMPMQTRTPFAVVSTLDSPKTQRLEGVDRDAMLACIQDLADDPGAVVTVRVEGAFEDVVVRSVPPQDPPYRPYAQVCQTDEVRWEHRKFYGVFVGFVFPDLTPGATIPGLHLHGLDRLRTTGGHNHELRVTDAKLTVSTSRDVVMQLPERSMTDLLETPRPMREVQREILRSGEVTVAQLATLLGITESEALSRLEWLADRGFVLSQQPPGSPEPVWRVSLRAPGARTSGRMGEILDGL